MTADQMNVAEKMFREASRSLGNLACVIHNPLEAQAELIDGWLDELGGRIEGMRSRVL
jgi:hypothetical protein